MAVWRASSSTRTLVGTGDVQAGTRPTRRSTDIALHGSQQSASKPTDQAQFTEPFAHLDLPDTAGIARLAQSGFTAVHGEDDDTMDAPILQHMIRQKRTSKIPGN